MNINGERRIPLPRETVWRALNDPAVLKACIPGCESYESVTDDENKVVIMAVVGPVKARFQGKLRLEDVSPPERYRLVFDGSGGAAGFGKGSATVELAEDRGVTLVRYDVNAQVGGKLAQVGARLIEGVARKLSEEFFTRFDQHVVSAGQQDPAPDPAPVEGSAAAAADPEPVARQGGDGTKRGSKWMPWAVGIAVAATVLIYLFAK
ncbi:carbon monoxide dehydrogenase subunit G [uncultured Pigmentiphaga sp.]|uniref:SRPBCC family protein n=1 Tax=uncultured Pigmentiphaga sp. TaxID=340361 RepID=UPI00263150D3|nr:carbon monoxide dehydrogenase subunit G [uncultured Pigmentiphaga sp.]